jgi:hypothetical protein
MSPVITKLSSMKLSFEWCKIVVSNELGRVLLKRVPRLGSIKRGRRADIAASITGDVNVRFINAGRASGRVHGSVASVNRKCKQVAIAIEFNKNFMVFFWKSRSDFFQPIEENLSYALC